MTSGPDPRTSFRHVGGYRPLLRSRDVRTALPVLRWWPITRTGVKLVFSHRLLWVFLLLGLANFLFYSAMVYLVAEVKVELEGIGRGVRLLAFADKFIFTGTGESYRNFIFSQNIVVMLLLAFSGSLLVGNDFRLRSVGFYLSKPISKLDYFLGKLVAATALTLLITLVPAVVLYLEYGVFTESLDYFRDNQRVLWAILAYGLLVSVASSAVLLGVAALLERLTAVVGAWGAIFVFLPLVGATLRWLAGWSGVPPWAWELVNLWKVIWWISDALFGVRPEAPEARIWCAVAVLALWISVALSVFWVRVRAVEVVR